MLLNKAIRLFLDSIGRREEYEFYLNKFQAVHSPFFAVLVPDLQTIEESGELMVFDLDFLQKLGLCPLLLLCGPDATRMRDLLDDYGYALKVFESPDHLPDERVTDGFAVLLRPGLDEEDALLELVPGKVERVHFVRTAGGLQSPAGAPILYYYTKRHPLPALRPEDMDVVRIAIKLLARDAGTHISVTSPLTLLKEMFTVKGAGSVIRRGSRVFAYRSIAEIQTDRLVALLNESFGRQLRDVTLLNRVSHFFIEESYRGAALLETHGEGLYLSKFAVGTQARGEGLAQELWEAAILPMPAVFWRSRADNPINHWYEKQADGRHHAGRWQVFWRGVKIEDIPGLVRYCLDRPPDFIDSPE